MLTFSPAGYLVPVGKVATDLPTLERVFVTDFPTSTTRPRLWANYLAYLERFRNKVTGNFVQWLNGSFVTQKENPNDIDLVTFIDYSIFEPMEAPVVLSLQLSTSNRSGFATRKMQSIFLPS